MCKLQKAVYGLKHASQAWKHKLEKLVNVPINVDDFLSISDDEQLVTWIKLQMCVDFKMKDLGLVKQVLGLRVTSQMALS